MHNALIPLKSINFDRCTTLLDCGSNNLLTEFFFFLLPQVLSKEEYACWLKSHIEAESSIDNREELLFQSAVRIETDLHLLGRFKAWKQNWAYRHHWDHQTSKSCSCPSCGNVILLYLWGSDSSSSPHPDSRIHKCFNLVPQHLLVGHTVTSGGLWSVLDMTKNPRWFDCVCFRHDWKSWVLTRVMYN